MTDGSRSVNSRSRRPAASVSPSSRAASGSGWTASNEASASRARSAIETRLSPPEAWAEIATASTPATVAPVIASLSPSPVPSARAALRASRTSLPSAPYRRRRQSSWRPYAAISAPPARASTSSAVSSPRAAASRSPCRESATTAAGAATPATSSPAASTAPAAGRTAAATATETAPAASATSGGPIPRRWRFWSESTSATRRESRSPLRSPRSSAGASGSIRS